MSIVTISQRGEERSRTGHPWIYKSDVARVDAAGGDTVTVMGVRGRAIGQALYSDRSEIALRLLTHGAEPADTALWTRRLAQAVEFRQSLSIDATAYRLVPGEGDPLPSPHLDR